jgi:hypothetical protein
MAKEITPVELTYHGFRHSQGRPNVQSYIFHYVSLLGGVEPSFELADDTLNTYLSRVFQPKSLGHAKIGNTRGEAIDGVTDALAAVESEYIGVKPTLAETCPDLQTTSRFLAADLMSNETYYLQRKGFEADEHGNDDRTRHTQRVRGGRSSFLYYFGRDKHTTGFTELNRMYEDIWNSIELVQPPKQVTKEAYSTTIDTHTQAVRNAELRYGGGLILARPESAPQD